MAANTRSEEPGLFRFTTILLLFAIISWFAGCDAPTRHGRPIRSVEEGQTSDGLPYVRATFSSNQPTQESVLIGYGFLAFAAVCVLAAAWVATIEIKNPHCPKKPPRSGPGWELAE